MDLGAALMALLISAGVKLGVLILGGRLVLRLYRARSPERPARLWILLPDRDAREIRVLWWSLVLFFASELTCGVEVYVLFQSNDYLSGFHGVVSATAMGLFALGLYLLFDGHIMRYGGKGCGMNAFCRGCTIRGDEGCKYTHLIVLAATFVALAAVYPMFVSTDRLVADTSRYILPFESLNAWYEQAIVPWLQQNVHNYDPTGHAYFIRESTMILEFRVLPAIAVVAAVAAIVLLRTRRERAGVEVLAFAAGFLCYPYFELVLYKTTDDVILGSLGHEVGEFWFLLAAAELLRVTFASQRREAGARSLPVAEDAGGAA